MNDLKRTRVLRGVSQAELSKKSGVAQNAISEIERGIRAPRAKTLRSLAEALNVEVEVLTSATGYPWGEPGPLEAPPAPKEPETPLPPLEEIQRRANLLTEWHLMPEEAWREDLRAEEDPAAAYERFKEVHVEREAMLPEVGRLEQGLDVRIKGISGTYRRVYMRTLEAWSAAHRVAVKAGAIGRDDSLEVLEAQRIERALEEEKSQVLVAS